jgi:hypothetical protein
MQLFMAVPMTPSAAVSDFGGRVRLQRPEISPICPDLQKAVVNTVYFGENLSVL